MDFLFEIGLEELPARYIDNAEKNLKTNIEKELKNERINYSKINSYSTPRRLAIYIEGLSENAEDLHEKKIGPSYEIFFNNEEVSKVGMGFLKSQNISIEDIKIIETDKGKYTLVEKFQKGLKTKEILSKILDKSIRNIEFEKSMKWSDKSFRFARPIKWFVSILDNKVLEFEFENIKASNETRGMRGFASQNIKINDMKNYIEILKENFVIADKFEREKMILESIKNNCEKDGDVAVVNKYLLEEVVNLVEYPFAIKGEFNEEYLELPKDIITITMETHQRYFPVNSKNGELTNKFILIRNAPVYSELVKKGNEKVIEPRLADAKFFYDEDLKISLESNLEKLKNVMFQKDMGTIYEKVERSKKIADYIISELNMQDKREDVLKTVILSKADLVSNVISEKEFTKLQGFMGSIYAKNQGEKEDVSKGIFEHYLPRYQGDKMPTTLEGAITGISDKMDTIVGCFAVNLKPTSSKDPYALRRAAQGILLVALEFKLNLDYEKLVDEAFNIFKSDKKVLNDNTASEVKEFLKQRLEYILSEKYSKNLVSYEINLEKNIKVLDEKLSKLKEISKSEDFETLINLLKRVKNIVKDNKFNEKADSKLFLETSENDLHNFSKKLIDYKESGFDKLVDVLIKDSKIIDNYFNTVIINVENEVIRNNRLSLLSEILEIIGDTIEIW